MIAGDSSAPGDVVVALLLADPGDVLVLEGAETAAAAQFEVARNSLAQANAAFEELLAGASSADLAIARREVELAEAALSEGSRGRRGDRRLVAREPGLRLPRGQRPRHRSRVGSPRSGRRGGGARTRRGRSRRAARGRERQRRRGGGAGHRTRRAGAGAGARGPRSGGVDRPLRRRDRIRPRLPRATSSGRTPWPSCSRTASASSSS